MTESDTPQTLTYVEAFQALREKIDSARNQLQAHKVAESALPERHTAHGNVGNSANIGTEHEKELVAKISITAGNPDIAFALHISCVSLVNIFENPGVGQQFTTESEEVRKGIADIQKSMPLKYVGYSRETTDLEVGIRTLADCIKFDDVCGNTINALSSWEHTATQDGLQSGQVENPHLLRSLVTGIESLEKEKYPTQEGTSVEAENGCVVIKGDMPTVERFIQEFIGGQIGRGQAPPSR